MQRKAIFVMVIILLSILFLTGQVVLAGGWAVVTLDELPAEVVANQPVAIGFVVRQHGQTPMAGLSPLVKAVHGETQKKVEVSAKAEGAVGHYVATLSFPEPGEWRWWVEAFTGNQPMPPLQVGPLEAVTPTKGGVDISWPLLMGLLGLFGTAGSSLVWWYKRAWWAATLVFVALGVSGAGLALAGLQPQAAEPAAVAASPGLAEVGRDLFIAKGCTTCHAHSTIKEKPDIFIGEGPDLTNFPTTAEYLRTWLKEPAAIKPNTQMPNLELKEAEIEALTAFLLEENQAGPAAQSQPQPARQAEADTPASEPLFLVRAQGAKGPLVVYRMPDGQEQVRLPAGLLSADGKRYYAAELRQDETLLRAFEPRSGRLERSFSLAGRWQLSGVSPLGHRLALTRLPDLEETAGWRKARTWQTDIQIVEAAGGRVTHAFTLEGNFEVETISAAGDSLFLIEHRPALKPAHYLVRLYDLAAQKLQPGALRAKTATEEIMTGLAWGGLASTDGRWLLTLYLNTARNVAFIHALDLVNKIPFCIDLPSGQGELAQLKHYALSLAPDGRTVYATNAALGVVAEINLENYRVVRQVDFPASAPVANPVGTEEIPTNYSIMAEDGQRLYFSNGWDVWGFDISSKQVSGPYLSQSQVRGLGLSQDGRQLYVALAGQLPQVIDLASGQAAISKR